MENEYINKIVEIGKKEVCTPQDLAYFQKELPDVGNIKLRITIERDYKIKTGHITRQEFLSLKRKIIVPPLSEEQEKRIQFITHLIKGCHLIEIQYGGFGSTTNVFNLFESLIEMEVNRAIDLYNWIAFNGGNYYIEPNCTFVEHEKIEQEIEKRRIALQQSNEKTYLEAITQKKFKRNQHIARSVDQGQGYREFKERFRKYDNNKLIQAFNREVRNTGWTSTRGSYLVAIQEEFERRGYDYSAIGNKKGVSFAKKIKLIKKKIIVQGNK